MIEAWIAARAAGLLKYLAMAALVLGLICYAQYEKSQAEHVKHQTVVDELVETRAANERLVAAEKEHAAEMERLRKDYEKAQRALKDVPDDGCLDRDLPADALRLLKPAP